MRVLDGACMVVLARSVAFSRSPRRSGVRPTSTGAAHRLRQQDGPYRCQLFPRSRPDARASEGQPDSDPDVHRCRRWDFKGVVDLDQDEGFSGTKTPRARSSNMRTSRPICNHLPRMAREDGRGCRRDQRRADEQVPNGGRTVRTRSITKARSAHHRRRDRFPDAVRFGVQNKGVQAMLDAVIDLPSPVDIPGKGETEDERRRANRRRRAVLALAFKIATDPFVGLDLLPRLFRRARSRATRSEPGQGQ